MVALPVIVTLVVLWLYAFKRTHEPPYLDADWESIE